jgi:hypothetical protein
MRSLVLSVLTLALCLASSKASAAGIEARERAAKKACLTGDPAKGVEILADLFIDTNDPGYIFNQGRCFEQNNRYDDAIGRFREYLRKAKTASAEGRTEAEKHIADCQALLGKKDGEPPRPASPVLAKPEDVPAALPPTPSPGQAAAIQPTTLVVTERAQPSDGTGSGLRVAGVVTASVGMAALIAGLVLNLKYNGSTNDLRSNWSAAADSSSRDYKTMSAVGYGAGAGCVAAGAVLYLIGWNAGKTAFAPTVVAGLPGALLTGEF